MLNLSFVPTALGSVVGLLSPWPLLRCYGLLERYGAHDRKEHAVLRLRMLYVAKKVGRKRQEMFE